MTFGELVQKIFPYFQKRVPPAETVPVWSTDAGKYPLDFYDWAFSRLKSGKKEALDNFPMTIRELWQEYLRQNPNRVERREFHCRQRLCEEGLLFVLKGNLSFVFRCGECDARQELRTYQVATMRQLEQDGYVPNNSENREKNRVQFDQKAWIKRPWVRTGSPGYERLEKLARLVTEELPF